MDYDTCKNDRRLQLRASMNCRVYKTYTWAAEQLAWNNVDSHEPVCVDWTGGAFVRAQSLRSCRMNKCHFTIIMSCVQSTLRNINSVNIRPNAAFGNIRPSDGFRTYAILHCLNQIRIFYNFQKTFLTITFVIIRYTKNFSNISFLALNGLWYLQKWSSPAA